MLMIRRPSNASVLAASAPPTSGWTRKRAWRTAAILIVAVLFWVLSYSWWLEGVGKVRREITAQIATTSGVSRVLGCPQASSPLKDCSIRLDVVRNLSVNWDVTVEPLGESSPEAKSDEVWLFEIATGNTQHDFASDPSVPAGWERRPNGAAAHGTVVLSPGGRPKPLRMRLSGGTLFLRFLKHAWSGRVRVTANGVSKLADLYSSGESQARMYFQPVPADSQPAADDGVLGEPREYRIRTPYSWPSDDLYLRPWPAGALRIVSAVAAGQPLARRSATAFDVPGEPADLHVRAVLCTTLLTALVGALLFAAVDLCRRSPFLRSWVFPFLAVVTMSVVWTAICYPGNISLDTVDMLNQARTGVFTDWHGLSLTLWERIAYLATSRLPFEITVALCALTSGMLFWGAILASLYAVTSHRLARFGGVLLLLAYYPLWLYAPTLLKDVWFVIFFLPMSVLLWRMVRAQNVSFGRLALLGVLLFGALLSRQTALVSYFCLLALLLALMRFVLGHKTRGVILAALAIAGLVVPVAREKLFAALNVQRVGNAANLYFLYDLVGTLHFTGKPVDRFKYLQVYQVAGREALSAAMSQYSCDGNSRFLVSGGSPPFAFNDVVADSYSYIDLISVAAAFPPAYLKHKSCVLEPLLDLPGTSIYEPFVADVSAHNPWRLTRTSLLPPLHRGLIGFLRNAAENPGPLQQPFRHYLVAIVSALLVLASAAFPGGRYRRATRQTPLALWLAGLAVLAPMLIVVPMPNWRYLMPATTLWLLAGCVASATLVRTAIALRRLSRRSRNA
jgi:hypothetical protein